MLFNEKSQVDAVRMSTSRLRQRVNVLRQPATGEILPKHREKSPPRQAAPIPLSHFTAYALFAIIVYAIVVLAERRLPTALRKSDENRYPGRFVAERARDYLVNLTRLGPRPVGSFANEVLAVNYLARELNAIAERANAVHRITTDAQKVSGAFALPFLDGMTNIYKDVQNVLVKIAPAAGESKHSLLVNCHYDTVIDSPGGSDDGASCAIMLEMVRVLSQRSTPLKHNVIFLFNGAEENFMQASHGFITQHRWASSVRAFINLEACGAGGREILFQAGPEHPWLMQLYTDTAPYPLASSLAQEVFQSGLVPGDTDFRIFRDFGKISGLDFAWSTNGYVYHTKLDDVHQIPLGTLQHTGDNILPLIEKMANSEYLSNVDAHSKGNLVFFDFLGAFIVSAKEMVANVVNLCVATLCAYSIWSNVKRARGNDRKIYWNSLYWGIGYVLISWLLTLVIVLSIAYLITLLNRPLSWYARPIWIFFLYIIPTFTVPVVVAQGFRYKFQKAIHSPLSLYRIYHDSNLMIFTTVSFTLTLLQVRSNFIVSIWLLFSFLNWILREKIFSHWKDYRFIWLHAISMILPFSLTGYIINGVSLLIVPIMGRSGSGNYAELVLAFIMSIMLMLMFSFYVPLTLLVRNVKRLIKGLSILFFSALLVLLFTPLGFPYSGDLLAPAPQRYIITHVDRTFYDINSNVRKNDSGLWVVNMDVNSPRMVTGLVPDMSRAELITEDCESELYCGLPYCVPVMSIMWETHWIPAPRPATPTALKLNLTYRDFRVDNIQRLSFTVNGPDHMTLFLSPYPDVELNSWSLLHGPPLEGPKWKGRKTYFILYSYGSDPQPWNFWIDLILKKSDHTGPAVEVGLGGYYVHGTHQLSPELTKLFSQFPPWTVTSGWISEYKAYTF